MRKNGFTLLEFVIAILVLTLLAAIIGLELSRLKSEKEVMAVMATEESYDWDWGYPFPSAEEFGESDSYSIVWIGESSWIWKRFLLIRAKEIHRDYGRLPFLLKAIPDVERKGYIIVSKEFLTTDPHFADSALVDSLLLEIRPPENTKNTEKKNP